jgi:heme a synthase
VSAVLVATAVLLHHRAGAPPGPTRPAATPAVLRWSRALVGLAAVVLVTGTLVTGSGPHGGDEAADRLPFAVRTVVPLHSGAVWALLAAAVVVLHRVDRGDAGGAAAARGRALLAAIGLQGGLGYLQYFTGVPEGLVALHVLGSVVVWAAVLRFHLALQAPIPGPVRAATPTAVGAAS